MRIKYLILFGFGLFTVFFTMVVLIGHQVEASKSCSTQSDHFTCTVTVDDGKNLYVTDMNYKKNVGGTAYRISYWDYTAYIEIDTNTAEMNEYDYNQGGDSTSMTKAYGGDGIIQTPKAYGCSSMTAMYLGTINSKNFFWEQSLTTCDLSTASLDYARFEDHIGFNDTPGATYYLNVYHRSWTEPHSTTNANFYAYKLDSSSATWEELRNELSFSVKNPDGSGYKLKVKDYTDSYAINYTPWPTTDANNIMFYLVGRRSGGVTDGYPLYAMTGEDTHSSETDIWWVYRDTITSTGDSSIAYNSYYPDRSSW